MPLHSFANFKLIMSRHRKDFLGALGHGLIVNPSLMMGAQQYDVSRASIPGDSRVTHGGAEVPVPLAS